MVEKMKYLQSVTAILGFLSMGLAQAASPVAIVEDVQAKAAGVEIMDFLHAGQKITLAKGESMTIGYMDSCRRESIKGGHITIGDKQSQVSNGMVIREDVECDGGQAKLTGQQGAKSGALAFRGGSPSVGLQGAKSNIYGSSPVIILSKPNQHIVIENMANKADRHELNVKGSHIDLADHNIELVAGNVYQLQAGEQSTTFKVVAPAEPGKAPLISRLVRL